MRKLLTAMLAATMTVVLPASAFADPTPPCPIDGEVSECEDTAEPEPVDDESETPAPTPIDDDFVRPDPIIEDPDDEIVVRIPTPIDDDFVWRFPDEDEDDVVFRVPPPIRWIDWDEDWETNIGDEADLPVLDEDAEEAAAPDAARPAPETPPAARAASTTPQASPAPREAAPAVEGDVSSDAVRPPSPTVDRPDPVARETSSPTETVDGTVSQPVPGTGDGPGVTTQRSASSEDVPVVDTPVGLLIALAFMLVAALIVTVRADRRRTAREDA